MLYGLLGNIKESLRYSFHNTVGRPLFWLGVMFFVIVTGLATYAVVYFKGINLFPVAVIFAIVHTLIDIVFLGFNVQILGNKELTFKGFTKTYLKGIKAGIIEVIYYAVLLGLFLLLRNIGIFGTYNAILLSLFTEITAGSFSLDTLSNILSFYHTDGTNLVSMLLIIVFILISFIAIMIIKVAQVNYARSEKFKDGFNFPLIHTRIKKVGVSKFIVAIIIYAFIFLILATISNLIVGLFGFLLNEDIASILLIFILAPLSTIFSMIFPIKYVSSLFVD